MVLIELPIRFSTTNVASTEIGIESNTAPIARMLPRKIKIMKLVRNNPVKPSCSTVLSACRTNTD